MKAITYTEYGPADVLKFAEAPKPSPADGEVLLRIRAASVNPYDWHFMRGMPYFLRLRTGLRRPKDPRLGVDAAGQVEAVGKDVTRFKPGDEVFGLCKGAFAESGCASADVLAVKPANLTFEQAAAVPLAGLTALQGLRDSGRIQPGQRVLINGAAGGVGTFAVQIARSFGTEVTGVCSTRNVEMLLSIGADHVVDYSKEDFTASGLWYELILDLAGNRTLSDLRRILTPEGTLVVVGGPNEGRWLGPLAGLLRVMLVSRFVRQKLLGMMTHPSKEDLDVLRELLEAGKVAPVVDRSYPLSDTSEAIRYVEQGHARGKVVIATEDRPGGAAC